MGCINGTLLGWKNTICILECNVCREFGVTFGIVHYTYHSESKIVLVQNSKASETMHFVNNSIEMILLVNVVSFYF